MDLRGQDHQGETEEAAPVGVEPSATVAVPRSDGSQAQLRQIIALRDAVRVELHRQLDDNLDLKSGDPTMAQSLGGTVLDELVIASMAGAGINLALQTRHPQEAGAVQEDPSVTAELAKPKSLIHMVP